jgi:hypothetical protein
MIKAGKDYKMTKGAKILLSQIGDPHMRGEFKKTVVESELYERQARHNKMKNYNVASGQGEEV